MQAHLGLPLYQALHVGTLHGEQYGGLCGLGISVPEAVGGEGHLTEDRTRVHHLQGELARAFHLVDAHAALLEDKQLAVRLLGSVEDLACSQVDLSISPEEVSKDLPYLLLLERLEDVYLGK